MIASRLLQSGIFRCLGFMLFTKRETSVPTCLKLPAGLGDKYHGVALQELAKLNKPFKTLVENGESTFGMMKFSGKRSTRGTSVNYSHGIPRYLEVQFWMDDGWVNIHV